MFNFLHLIIENKVRLRNPSKFWTQSVTSSMNDDRLYFLNVEYFINVFFLFVDSPFIFDLNNEDFVHWIRNVYRWVTGWQWCWWHRYVCDFMMVTDLRCWWQNHYVGDFFRYVGDFLNVLNRSPLSWIGHKHLKLVTNTFGLQHPSPTSM